MAGRCSSLALAKRLLLGPVWAALVTKAGGAETLSLGSAGCNPASVGILADRRDAKFKTGRYLYASGNPC